MSRIHLSEEEVYDIFRNIFHNEEDALAATIQLFRYEPIVWETIMGTVERYSSIAPNIAIKAT